MGEKIGWVFSDGASALFRISNCDAAKLKKNETFQGTAFFLRLH